MKVGILLPMYNALPYIETCMRSLKCQTYPVKVYVIDDCSDDYKAWVKGSISYNSYDFVRLRNHDVRRNEKNLGWPKNLNKCAKWAIQDGCDLLFTMNADDWLRIDAIEKLVEAINGGIDGIEYDWANCYGQQIGDKNVVMEAKAKADLDDFKECTVLPQFGLFRVDAWEEVGGYSEDIGLSELKAGYEDWEFYIKLLEKAKRYIVIKDVLYYYRMHKKQLYRKTTSYHKVLRDKIWKKHFN